MSKPTAYTGPFPIMSHRTMQQVADDLVVLAAQTITKPRFTMEQHRETVARIQAAEKKPETRQPYVDMSERRQMIERLAQKFRKD